MSDYTPTDKPINGAWLTSKVIRDEFDLIQTAVNSKANSLGLRSVSTTSLTIADVLQTFTMETGKEFVPGETIFLADSSAPSTNYMIGILTAYSTTTGLSTALISSHVGGGTIASWVIGISNSNGVTLVNNTFTGHQNFARATVASAATTADIWSALGNQIDFTGTATVTGFPAATQAGSSRRLICAGACSFTAGANMLIDGVSSGSTVTCAANDIIDVEAVTTAQFRLSRIRYDGKPVRDYIDNYILITGGNGHGSSSTHIRLLTTTVSNVGTAFTIAHSATFGTTITINESGLYTFAVKDSNSAAASATGLSVNAPSLTTAVSTSGNLATCMGRIHVAAALGVEGVLSVTDRLTAGDIVRLHDGGANNSTGADTRIWGRKLYEI